MSGHITEKVQTTVLEFIADLKETIFTDPTDAGDLALVEFFFKKMTGAQITDHIVRHVLPHKSKIKSRDVQFFVSQKNEIFAGMPKDRVDYFVLLVEKPKAQGGLAEDDREVIWAYFDMLILLTEEYKKKK